jgi:hypothetical protein
VAGWLVAVRVSRSGACVELGEATAAGTVAMTNGGTVAPRPMGVSKVCRFHAGGVNTWARSGSTGAGMVP